jgi:hypothetical protein
MIHWRRLIIIALLLTGFSSGCLPVKEVRPRASRQPPPGPVGHIVVFWLKQPGDPQARRRVILASLSFHSVPGVVRVEAGDMLASPRPNVDKTYDVVVVMWFRDRQALEEYQVHPQHQAMLEEVGPLVERVVVYDFERFGSVKGK